MLGQVPRDQFLPLEPESMRPSKILQECQVIVASSMDSQILIESVVEKTGELAKSARECTQQELLGTCSGPSSYRLHSSTQPIVGKNHFRYLRPGNSEEIQVGAGGRSLPESLSYYISEKSHGEPDFNRSREPGGKGCSYNSEQPIRRLLLKDFPGIQEGRPASSSDESLAPQQDF